MYSKSYVNYPKKPELTQEDWFKIAQLEGIEIRNYLLEKFGRCEANWFDEHMSRMVLKYKLTDEKT